MSGHPDPTADDSPSVVRPADPSEFEHLRWIELESDRLLEEYGIGPFPVDEGGNRPAVATAFAVGEPAVGFVFLGVVDDAAHVDQVSVLPEHGRRGIGRALLEAAVGWAREVGVTKLELHVFPWNEPAIRLYEQFGYEREGYRKSQYKRGDGQFADVILMAYRVQ